MYSSLSLDHFKFRRKSETNFNFQSTNETRHRNCVRASFAIGQPISWCSKTFYHFLSLPISVSFRLLICFPLRFLLLLLLLIPKRETNSAQPKEIKSYQRELKLHLVFNLVSRENLLDFFFSSSIWHRKLTESIYRCLFVCVFTFSIE